MFQLPVPTRWYSVWTLISSILKYEHALKQSIWDTALDDETKCEEIRKLLCNTHGFWSNLKLVEEMLSPLAKVIKFIEGEIVDARAGYKAIDSAFDKSIEASSKFENEELQKVFTEVCYSIFFKTYIC